MRSVKLLGFIFAKKIAEFREIILRQCGIQQGYESADVRNLLDDHLCKHYLVTDEVIRQCTKIDIRPSSDIIKLVIPMLKDGIMQWSFGDRFVRFLKKEHHLLVLYGKEVQVPMFMRFNEAEAGVTYAIIQFSLKTGIVNVIEGMPTKPIEMKVCDTYCSCSVLCL